MGLRLMLWHDIATLAPMVDAQGQSQPRVFILGSLRIGCVWESIAIPELRGQAETAVRGLLAPDT